MSSLHIPKNQEEEGVNPGQPHNKSKFFSPLTFFELLPYLNENQLKKNYKLQILPFIETYISRKCSK